MNAAKLCLFLLFIIALDFNRAIDKNEKFSNETGDYTILSNKWDDLEAFGADPYLQSEDDDDNHGPDVLEKSHENAESSGTDKLEEFNQQSVQSYNQSETGVIGEFNQQTAPGSDTNVQGFKVTKPHSNRNEKFVRLGMSGNSIDHYEVQKWFHHLSIDEFRQSILSRKEIERIFYNLSDHNWTDLQNYRIINYSTYWGHVCGFFWNMPEQLYYSQGCIVTINPNGFSVRPSELTNTPTVTAKVLKCVCYYFDKLQFYAVFEPATFFIYLSKEGKCFKLHQVFRQNLRLSNYWPVVYLPHPTQIYPHIGY